MPKTATKKAPSSRASWSKEETSALADAVKQCKAEGSPLQIAFTALAESRGTSWQSVRAKYYNMQHRTKKRTKAVAKATQSASKAPAAPKTQDPVDALSELTMGELRLMYGQAARTAAQTSAEIQRRIILAFS